MKIKTEFNAVPSKGESFVGIRSLTVPGQAIDLKVQVAKGLAAGQFMVRPIHFTESEIPLPPMDDLVDISNAIDYQRKMEQKMAEWEKLNKEAKQKREDEKYNAEMEKKFQAYLEEQQKKAKAEK